MKNKLIFLMLPFLLGSCNEYICKGKSDYKPSNFVSFFRNKEILTDKIAYLYKDPGSEGLLVENNSCGCFKSVDSDRIIGVLEGHACNYYVATGASTLTKDDNTIEMQLDSNLSVNDVALKFFEKLEITPVFSSNDMLLAVGEYFLKKDGWEYIPCLYYHSIALYVYEEDLEEDVSLQNNIKKLLGNDEDEYFAWKETCYHGFSDSFAITIGMNSDETKLEPEMALGSIRLTFPKDSEKLGWKYLV